jgi:hypothetical protein
MPAITLTREERQRAQELQLLSFLDEAEGVAQAREATGFLQGACNWIPARSVQAFLGRPPPGSPSRDMGDVRSKRSGVQDDKCTIDKRDIAAKARLYPNSETK